MFKFSDINREMDVYSFSSATGEYLGVAHISIPANTGLPQYMTDIEPHKPNEGYVLVFNVESMQWDETRDHRGKTAYRKDTREEVRIYSLGPLSDHFTFLVPNSPYDVWINGEWVKDETAENAILVAAAESKKSNLLNTVTIQIDTLQDMKEFGMASDEELAKLDRLRRYRILLNKIDTAEKDIIWPEI